MMIIDSPTFSHGRQHDSMRIDLATKPLTSYLSSGDGINRAPVKSGSQRNLM